VQSATGALSREQGRARAARRVKVAAWLRSAIAAHAQSRDSARHPGDGLSARQDGRNVVDQQARKLTQPGAASDRLRDIFIAAVFKKTTEKYATGKYQDQSRTWYATPFKEALEYCNRYGQPIVASLATLPSLAERVQAFRRMRNEIVQDVATKFAQRESEHIDGGRSFVRLLRSRSLADVGFRVLDRAESAAEHKKEINEEGRRPIDWYMLLIQSANQVFIVENKLRSSGQSAH
jgi:hypothetical protein